MKAGTKKTRWLLVGLLFGVVAAAGFTLVHHHGSRTIAKANDAAAPKHTVRQQTHAALLAASGGRHSFRAPAAVHPELLDTSYSDASQPAVNGHPDAPWHTANSTAWTYPAAHPAAHPVGRSSTTPAPSNRPATSGNQLPQVLADGVAYNYAPLDCELPAGCGATAGASSLTRQPAGTSGGGSFVHNSQAGSSTNNSSTPDTTNDTGDTGSTGNKGNIGNTTKTSDPTDPSNPGSNQVAAAPELDPGTLAAAVTLLFGGLAILRSRRFRATR